ncbi:hypothetical protein C4K24_1986 [Pseudomonas chlororaphis subsp. aurantiaca]|nr:hypothetical protein C4K24_1986 [Pseudomonas chlororaphis subsp. aurantiaca]AZD53844.1 hypothetical protein C4K19_2047 [Pseudomonas chlororaphis subsp. aurantiaca]
MSQKFDLQSELAAASLPEKPRNDLFLVDGALTIELGSI